MYVALLNKFFLVYIVNQTQLKSPLQDMTHK